MLSLLAAPDAPYRPDLHTTQDLFDDAPSIDEYKPLLHAVQSLELFNDAIAPQRPLGQALHSMAPG